MDEHYKQAYIKVQRDRQKLMDQNQRYREALEFYADDLTYTDGQYTSTGQLVSTGYFNIMSDNGEIARKALEGEEYE